MKCQGTVFPDAHQVDLGRLFLGPAVETLVGDGAGGTLVRDFGDGFRRGRIGVDPLACTLGTNTSGCDSTQPREWMHFFASKRMRIFLPSTISMALMRPILLPDEPILRYPRAPKRVKLSPIPTAQRPEVHLGSFDSRDSLPDAGNPAKEEKREEGRGRGGQAGEEAREVER